MPERRQGIMGIYVTDEELKKHLRSIGYEGCKNCKHQISPLRMCRWAELGGDGQLHFVCPKWDKAESENKE